MALIIGITGSIASGKSTACQVMADEGAVHCDADKLVHRLYDPGTQAFDRIVNIFGHDIVGMDGYINRRILGSKVFGEPRQMARLTTAIGSIADAIQNVIDEWRKTLETYEVGLIEAVNLIEAGYAQWCDQIWLFTIEPKEAEKRLMNRNNLTNAEVQKRLSIQRPWGERAPAADIIIPNNQKEECLISQVILHYQNTLHLAKKRELKPSKYHRWRDEQTPN